MPQVVITFLDCLAIVQGLIFGLFIIFNTRKKLAAWFFGLFVLTYAIELGDSILYSLDYINDNNQALRWLPLNFYFLNLPLLYLYVLSITKIFEWRKHFWFLIPGIIEFILFTALTIFYRNISPDSFNNFFEKYELASMVFYCAMSIFIIIQVYRIQQKINNVHSSTVDSNLMWVIVICSFLICYILAFMIFDLEKNSFVYFILNVSNVIFIYFLGILGLKQKYIGLKIENEDVNSINDSSLQEVNNEDQAEEETSINTDSESNDANHELYSKIEAIILKEQLYLNAELDLMTLSRKLRMNGRKVSESIKSATGKNFKKYINGHRITHAKSLLMNDKNTEYTMTSIGYDSGFQSKSTFYASFNEEIGMTPTEFRESVCEV